MLFVSATSTSLQLAASTKEEEDGEGMGSFADTIHVAYGIYPHLECSSHFYRKVDKHPSCSQIYGWIDKEGLSSQIYDCPPNFNSNHQATCAPTAAGGTPSTFTLDSLVGTCSAATGGLSSTLAFGSCLGTCFVSTGGASSRFALGSCAGTYSVDKAVFCCFEGGLEVELESFSIGKCSLKRRCCSHG
ncbi:hypothetical protein LWI28_005611 [Acer negundo]|uniref:Uncharacterized protein n=1 Tax=Acer negundo TaxID=4023 RepID=A0AAD5J342_ACENE|nr:hypothetical protein LWI28_005611 [Acer negundo]